MPEPASQSAQSPPHRRGLPRPRFSLLTLLAFVLTGGAGAFLYRDWEPWREVAVVEEQPDKLLHDDMMDVKTVAVSPDGNFFTTSKCFPAEDDNQWEADLNVIDAHTGRIVVTMRGHKNFISSAAFSPDGSKIITAGGDGTARIWNAKTGNEERVIRPEFRETYENYVTCAVFLSNDSAMTAGYLGDTYSWDLTTGKSIYKLPGTQRSRDPATLAFVGGTRSLTVTLGNSIWCLWDAQTGHEFIRFGNWRGDWLDGVRISDGHFLWGLKTVSYPSWDSHIPLVKRLEKWDLNNGMRAGESDSNVNIKSFVTLSDGDCAVGLERYEVKRLDGATLSPKHTIAEPNPNPIPIGSYVSLSVSSDGSRLFAGGPYGRIQVFNVQSGLKIYETSVHEQSREICEFKPVGQHPERMLVVCEGDESYASLKSVHLLERRRPEYWWGVAWLPEFWLTLVFGAVLLRNLWRGARRR